MIAIVPARGGSKGLPGKNLRPLAGKPLIRHTLECAMRAKEISNVVVSTDDPEIAESANTVAGVEVPFLRPAELSGDYASAVDVYLHAAEWIGSRKGPVEAICALLPTAPLRRPDDVDACIALFRRAKAESVLSVVGTKPTAWHQTMCDDGRLTAPAGVKVSIDNRQSFGRTVIPNGSIYVLDLAALAASRSYFGARTFGYEMPASRSIDIDGEDDLLMAEALLAYADRR